ncbi:A disintegrin and metalloproteinase with thrombospondin motifs 3 [Amphibalanus amphitrite]|uniref:A disintegrin and metalloproteinase with thrombospondin motifs 3 n=1 Tax=Amphibalanus amphitrite TaxID=1232801 RepID=A0A6A4VAD4_AMPAM|nr:A disintegrin and metalloproteinase with thrombospondin motifs 3 [Amphibalanus amphitrite]
MAGRTAPPAPAAPRRAPAVLLAALLAALLCAGGARGLLVRPQVAHLSSGRVLVRLHGGHQRWTVVAAPSPLPAAVTWLGSAGAGGGRRAAGRCLYRGAVPGRPGSTAALSLCRGVWAVIAADGRTVTVQPAEHVRHTRGPHVLRSLNVARLVARHVSARRRKRGLLSRATVEPFEQERTAEQREEDGEHGVLIGDQWFPAGNATPAGAYRLPATAADLARPRWLELVVAADQSVVAFHGRHRVLDYVLTLLNVMSAVLEDSSLQARLRVVVTRIYLIESGGELVRPRSPLSSLRAVNQWAARLADPRDAVIWLTRKHLGGPAGYAPVSGACDPSRSASINRDQGLSSAFVVAHELGHMLGLTHDGESDQCDWAPPLGSVMAPLISATYNRFFWSNCSRHEYSSKVSWWTCLYNRPAAADARPVSSSLDRPLSVAEQCQFEFGPEYGPCRLRSVQRQCARLWCAPPGSSRCLSRRAPPLDGTPCGAGHWCVHGHCRPVHRPPAAAAPADWASWGRWGTCSRSCGAGVQRRRRQCLPAAGRCAGDGEQVRLCPGLPRCWEEPRAAFCRRQQPVGTWLATHSAALPCHFWCVRSTDGRTQHGEPVPEGVSCGSADRPAICVRGTCRALDCAGTRLLPPQSRPAESCGGCGSDSYHRCRVERRVLTLIPVTQYSLVARLPVGATAVTIAETAASPHRVALFVRALGQYLLNGPSGVRRPGWYEGSGVRFTYQTAGGRETLSLPGPLPHELDVQVQSAPFAGPIVLNVTYVPTRPEAGLGLAAAHRPLVEASVTDAAPSETSGAERDERNRRGAEPDERHGRGTERDERYGHGAGEGRGADTGAGSGADRVVSSVE